MYLMRFQETEAERALRRELRTYFTALRMELGLDEAGAPGEDEPGFRRAIRRLGQDGWLGIGWPKEYGGQARSAREQFILFNEVQRTGFPIPFLKLWPVGPPLLK